MSFDIVSMVADTFGQTQQWLFEHAVQPAMFSLDLGNVLEDGFNATGWLLVGLLQFAVLLLVIGPLERWRPVETVADRTSVRTDVLYTVIHRLGLFRLGLFFTIDPLWDALFGAVRLHGWGTWHLDAFWPGVTDVPWISLVLYLLVFDFVEYALHRAQHRFAWWWTLHAVHHSQRQMTMWSDNRNHFLDDLLRDSVVVVVAQLIGIAPSQFVAVVACMQLLESLQHANVRLSFGWPGERLLVSPRFHRLHHGIGVGHESGGAGTLGGRNFAVIFPIWDMLFRTADFTPYTGPTGIRDQLPVEGGRNYGQGLWAQQWLALKRWVGRA